MSLHISPKDLEKIVNGTLVPDELIAFHRHLSECELCSEKAASFAVGRAAAVSLHETPADDADLDEHLSYRMLSGYVDGQLESVDKEIADVHLSVCNDCSVQIEELYELRELIETEKTGAIDQEWSQSASNFSNLLSVITGRSFLKFAVPTFALLLLGVLIWFAWFPTQTPQNEVSKVVVPAENSNLLPGVENGPGNTVELSERNLNSSSPVSEIALVDGGSRIYLDENGNLKGVNAPQFENRVKSALTTQSIEISNALKDLRTKGGVLMGESSPGVPFALVSPVGTIQESDRPQFKWEPLKDAESYVVTIYDSNFNKIATSPLLQQSSWKIDKPLKRGVIYQWQVTAAKDGQEIKSPVRPAPDARFKVLDAAAANDIEAAKRQSRNSHLLLGIAYANAGMLDDAEREFQALLQKNPHSEIARRLLNKIKSAR